MEPERLPALLDTSYEVAIDPEPEPGPVVLVDPVPEAGRLLPVVPEHLRTAAGVRGAMVKHAGRKYHQAKYHGLRSPKYLVLTSGYAVAGAFRLAWKVNRWAWVLHAVPLEIEAALAKDGREFRSMHKEIKRTRLTRLKIVLAVAAGVLLALGAVVKFVPWELWPPLILTGLIVLARYGRPPDKRIMSQAVVSPRFRVLNADVVLRAYAAAKLHDPVKPDYQVTFASPMRRDHEGSGVHVDLPYGKGLKDAIDAKPSLASGLDVQVSQVFLTRDATSNRRHYLWVADRDPLAVPVGRTPLLACRATDIWKPAPFGLDERGQLVGVPLMWNSVLVSALPRAGKTFSARLLGLHAALDPHVKLDVFDFKGSPDWRKFALVADSCAFGLTPTKDGLPGDIFRATLEGIKADVQDRYRRLSELADKHPELCPEGKLTRRLARDPRFNMPVRVLILEEFQEVYDLEDISKQLAPLLTFLIKVAPGAGVIVIGSTQRPSGIGTGEVGRQFTNFRDNFAVRFGLRTSSWQVSELCLGAGAYSEGLDTSTLLPQYKGVGILRGATDASPTVRTYLADGRDAEKILTAARGLRERAGTLSGMAAGLETETPARDVLADVLAVFGNDTGLHWQVLAARLAKQLPERWDDATAESVSADVRAQGVPSVDVKAYGRALKGCRRADVERIAGP
jgi:hypothetical protein